MVKYFSTEDSVHIAVEGNCTNCSLTEECNYFDKCIIHTFGVNKSESKWHFEKIDIKELLLGIERYICLDLKRKTTKHNFPIEIGLVLLPYVYEKYNDCAKISTELNKSKNIETDNMLITITYN